MRYPRRIQKELEKQIKTRPVIVITGMRRVGKTTLLEMIYEKIESRNKVLLDIDNILNQRIFEEVDYNNMWANLKAYGLTRTEKAFIFLDEIQAMPAIVKAIKYLYDHYDVKFFVTGSSSFYLRNLFPESLAGRKIIYELYPLDFEEYLIFNDMKIEIHRNFTAKDVNKNFISYEKIKKLYDEYLEFGGFPQVVLEQDAQQKVRHLVDILNSYIEKDVRKLADFHHITVFRDLMLLLMQRVGSKLNITRLSSELGTSRETIYSYLSFLEGTYFTFLVSPYSRSVDREVSGTKKVFFCDNGIINQFSKIPDGSRLENAVYLNLRKYGELKYYQKRSGAEIDFILPAMNTAVEVKNRGSLSDYNRLSKVAKSLGIESYYLVSRTYVNKDGFIPASSI